MLKIKNLLKKLKPLKKLIKRKNQGYYLEKPNIPQNRQKSIYERPNSYLNFKKIENSQIFKFLKQQNLEYKTRGEGQIVIKACPLCKKPHNDQESNFWTLNIKSNSGAFLCFRCGNYGSWNEFVRNFIADGLYSISEEKVVVDDVEKKRNEEVLGNMFKEKNDNLKICLEFYEFLNEKNDFFFEEKNFSGLNKVVMDELDPNFGKDNNKRYFFTQREKIIGKKFLDVVKYLIEERKFKKKTLLNFEIGIGEEMFKDENDNLKLVKCIYFPMKTKEMIKKNEEAKITKLKIKGIGENKKYLRVFPSGADFGFFGTNIFDTKTKKTEQKNNNHEYKENNILNNLQKEFLEKNTKKLSKIEKENNFSSKALVITEGEYDAMAVNQATNLNTVSLPFGASNLPYKLLNFIDKFERVYLWMDFDSMGQMNVDTFCEKIGKSRSYVVKEISLDVLEQKFGYKKKIFEINKKKKENKDLKNVNEFDDDNFGFEKEEIFVKKIKDANDALKYGDDIIWYYLKNSEALPKKNILKFSELRDKVKERFLFADSFKGLKSSYFPWFNKNIKGFRRGE